MATTKIWDVSAHVSKLLAYVANKNKTTMEMERGTDNEEMRLTAEMLGLPSDHFASEEKKFVTGINCTPENANEVMLTLLEGTSPSNIQAYHGCQSFKPGEVTPDIAHAIGVQLANELWGEDFPIIVATHIDRGHVHNHFCLPASGFSGKRYHDCNATYKLMRDTSDRLCREYGLSVIENPSKDRSKHIAEVHAEKKGIPTMRDQIRADIDAVAKQEIHIKNFYNRMRLSHKYEVEQEELKKQMFDLKNKLERLDTAQNSSGSFIRVIRKFMTTQTLTPIVLQELIDKIEVFPIEGTGKNRTQRLVIHYRFVGCIDLPSIVPKHTYKLDSRQGVLSNISRAQFN